MDGGRYSNIAYDPQKDTWQILEPVLGSVPGPYFGADQFSIYKPETDTWIFLLSIPDRPGWYKVRSPKSRKGEVLKFTSDKLRNTRMNRQGDGVAIVTGKDELIYWLGGKERRSGFGENIVLPYDVLNAKWPKAERKRVECGIGAHTHKTIYKTNIPRMLERRIDHEAVVTSDGKIYVMGGRYEELKPEGPDCRTNNTGIKTDTGTMECYDPITKKWTYKKPMPVERFAFAAVVGSNDRIYTFGGGGQFTDKGSKGRTWDTYDRTDVYDPKTDTWSSRTPMPAPRDTHTGVLGINGKRGHP